MHPQLAKAMLDRAVLDALFSPTVLERDDALRWFRTDGTPLAREWGQWPRGMLRAMGEWIVKNAGRYTVGQWRGKRAERKLSVIYKAMREDGVLVP